MSQRAKADSKFLLKFLIIAIALLGWLLYCMYDGLIAYPIELERAKAYAEIKDIEEDDVRDQRWDKITTENGWKRLPVPKEPAKVAWSINEQWIQVAVCGLIAVPLLLWYFKKKRSWLEADDNSVRSSWGQSFKFDDVTQIDKKKWEKKGIALINYKDGGEEKTFKLDDLAYSREVVDQILFDLETKVGTDKIVNGEPERDPKIIAEEKRIAAAEKLAAEVHAEKELEE